MKKISLILAATIASSFGELEQMSDETSWLGYFVGWEERNYDFGIGSDGESLLLLKKRGKRASHKDMSVRYLIEEEIDGRWVKRKFKSGDGLTSEQAKGLEPKKPVVLTTKVTGDTVVEWTHIKTSKGITISPKLISKETKNEVRIGLEMKLPKMHRIEKGTDKRDLKKKVGGDRLDAIRTKDKKKIKVKFIDVDDDVTSEEFLAEGASKIEIDSSALLDNKLVFEVGDPKSSTLFVEAKGPLYNSFGLVWRPDQSKLGQKGCSITFVAE